MAPLFFCSLVHRQWHAVARARDGPTASHATRRTKHGHEASSALTASWRVYGGHLVLFILSLRVPQSLTGIVSYGADPADL